MNAPDRFTLTMSRFIRAPRERVFDAFATEAGISAWMAPRGMRVSAVRVDLKEGGAWSMNMISRDGGVNSLAGTYQRIERPGRLAFTWQWMGERAYMPGQQTLVEVELSEKDGGTQLDMRHSGFPAQAASDAHSQGWSSCLNRLNDALDPSGSAATLTLLGDPRSTYTRTVRLALAEKGVAYTMQQCGPHSPEVSAIHPFGRIPALRDGEIELWETDAIVGYLDDGFDGAALRPVGALDRARCAQWVSAVNSYMYDTMVKRYILQYIFPKGEGGAPDRKVIDTALAQMPAQLDALDQAYGGNDYLCGSNVCAADLFLAPILAYVQMFPEGGQLMASRPNLMRAQGVMRQRPSFITTVPQLAQ